MIPPGCPGRVRRALAAQILARRALVPIVGHVVDEAIRPVLATLAERAMRRDGGADPGLLQADVVGVGPVLRIGADLLDLAPGDPGMLLERPIQQLLVGHLTRRDLDRRDETLASAVHPDVRCVVEVEGDTVPRDQARVRVRPTDHQLIDGALWSVGRIG